jgi:hypothetical protein
VHLIKKYDLHTSARALASKAAKAAHEVGVVAKIERSKAATAWLWSISLAVLASGSGLFLLLQHRTSTAAIEKGNASTFAQDRTASIVLNQGSKNCQHKLFDNQSGRFSDATTPCPPDVPLDANGNPVPKGTLHTLNEISKSFR